MKILPGHTVKLDKIIETLAKSSYCRASNEEEQQSVEMAPERNKQLKVLAKKDADYEKQLERVLN